MAEDKARDRGEFGFGERRQRRETATRADVARMDFLGC